MWDLPTVIILSLLTLSLILLAVLKISKRRWALVPLGVGFAAVLSAVCVTCFQPQLPSTVTIPAGHGEVVLLACKGDAVLVNDTRGNASEAFVIYRTALEMRCTEIDSLIFCRYYNQATYFIARLSERIKIRTIHLPTPRDAREEAIAARMEQEACLHGISVVYDAEFSGD